MKWKLQVDGLTHWPVESTIFKKTLYVRLSSLLSDFKESLLQLYLNEPEDAVAWLHHFLLQDLMARPNKRIEKRVFRRIQLLVSKIRIKRPCPTAIEKDLYFISFLSPKFPRLLWSLRLLLPSRIILVLSSQSITSCLKCGCLNIPANKCRKMTMMHLWFHLPSSMQWFNHSLSY